MSINKSQIKKIISAVERKESIPELKKRETISIDDLKIYTDVFSDILERQGNSRSKEIVELHENARKDFEKRTADILRNFSYLRSELDKVKNIKQTDIDPVVNELVGIKNWVDTFSKQHKIDIGFISKEFSQTISLINQKQDDLIEELDLHKKISNNSIKSLLDTVKILEEDIKKFSRSIYEFGSSFSIFVNGITIGQTFGINLVAGSNITLSTAVNSQGFISITINSTGGGGSSNSVITTNGAINDSNLVFSFISMPTILCINGKLYTPSGGDITWSYIGGNVILSSPVGQNGFIFGITGTFSVVSISGLINDTNKSFTSAILPVYLVMNGASYLQSGGQITWSDSGGNITTSTPAGLNGQVFGLTGINLIVDTGGIVTGVN